MPDDEDSLADCDAFSLPAFTVLLPELANSKLAKRMIGENNFNCCIQIYLVKNKNLA